MNASEQPNEEWLHGDAPEVSGDQLLFALGDEFLAYLCATDPERIARVRQGEPLDEPRRSVWEAALQFARQFSLWRRPNASNDEFVPPPGQEFEPLSTSFGRFFELTESGVTVADALRLEAGGSIRKLPDRDDDLLRHALHWLARDLWPYLLLPPDRPGWAGFSLFGIGAAAFSHQPSGNSAKPSKRYASPSANSTPTYGRNWLTLFESPAAEERPVRFK